jgi:DNA-binding response OmpR family regulator
MGGTILVVDDHPDTLAGVTEFLSHAGYHTLSASTFETAMQMLDETEPDLLIVDVRLGDKNGIGLLIAGRARHPGLGMIVVTGYPDPVLELEARHQGASAFLIKPLSSDTLLEVVAQTLLASGRHRRWFRRRVKTALEARVDERTVRLLDVSQGGARIEVAALNGTDLPDSIELRFPSFGVVVPAAKVWTRRSDDTVLYGLAIQSTPAHAADAWTRVLVPLFAGTSGQFGFQGQ